MEGARLHLLLTALLVSTLLHAAEGAAGFTWLNDALNGVQFFRNTESGLPEVGPCQEAFKCEFDFANAPDYIKAIKLDVPLFGTRRVDEFISSGKVFVWNFQCNNIELRDISLISTPIDGSGKANRFGDNVDEFNTEIIARDIQLRCITDADIIDVQFILFTVFGSDISIPITLRNAKPEFGNGLGGEFNLRWTPTNGRSNVGFGSTTVYDGGVNLGAAASWSRNFPRATEFLQFPYGGGDIIFGDTNGACDLDIPQGSFLLTRTGGFGANIINAIVVLLIGVFEGVICGFIAGTANLEIDNVDYNNFNKLGGINLFINELNGDIATFKSTPIVQPTNTPLLVQLETSLLSRLNQEGQIDLARDINFKTDEIYKGFSKYVNDVLGAQSATIAAPYDLVVNEVVNALTDDTGKLTFTDLRNDFEVVRDQGYPSITLNTSLLRLNIELKGFEFTGLNTFKTFQVLENPSNFFRYVLRNQIELGELGYSFTIGLVLLAGDYVTLNTNGGAGGLGLPSPQRTIKVTGGFTDLVFDATTFLLVQPQRLLPIQIGALFGEFATISNTTKAVLYALDHLNFLGLAPQVGTFSPLLVQEVEAAFGKESVCFSQSCFAWLIELLNHLGAEIIALIQNGFALFKDLFEGGLNENLVEIIENGVKGSLNDFLESVFINDAIILDPYTGTGDANCFDPIDEITNAPCFFDYQTVALGSFTGLSTFIDAVIGGNPVKQSGTDINTLINVFLEYFLVENTETSDSIPLTFVGPGHIKFTNDIDATLNTAGSNDVFSLFVGGPSISQIDSVSSLTISENSEYSFDVNVGYGTGVILDEFDVPFNSGNLTFNIPLEIFSESSSVVLADEKFNISLIVGLEINSEILGQVNKARFYRLTIEQLSYTRCVFAALRRKELISLAIDIRTFRFTLPQEGSSSTNIGTNLTALNAEIAANPTLVEYVLQYFLDRFVNASMEVFNQPFNTSSGYPFELEECDTLPSPLAGTILENPFPFSDLAAFNEFLVESTKPQPNPRDQARPPSEFENFIVPDGEEAFDITNERNAFVSAFSNSLDVDSAKSILITLANTTVDPTRQSVFDPFIEVLQLEGDGSVSLVYDIGTDQNLNYEPEADGIIRGLKIRFLPLIVTNIDKISEVTLIKPYVVNDERAKFTTESTFSYDSSEKLTISFGAEIELHGEVIDRADEGILYETLNYTVELSAFDLEALTTLAVDANALNATKLEELLVYDEVDKEFGLKSDALTCVLPKLIFPNGFQFQQLQLVFTGAGGGISKPKTTVEGSIFSEALTGLIDSILDIIFTVLSGQLDNVSQGPVRSFVNELIATYLEELSRSSCDPIPARGPGKVLFPFNEAPLSDQLRDFIANDFFNPSSPLQIDGLLRGLQTFLVDNQESTTITVPRTTLPEYNGVDLGGVTALFGGVTLPGFGSAVTVQNLELLDNTLFKTNPLTPFRTRNRIKFTGPAKSTFRIAFSFEPDKIFPAKSTTTRRRQLQPAPFNYYDDGITNDLVLEISLTDLEISLDIDIKVDVNALMDLRVGNVLNVYNEPRSTPCFLAIFDEDGLVPQATNITFAPGGVEIGLSCQSICNSEALEPLSLGSTFSTNNEVSRALSEALVLAIDLAKVVVASSDAQEYLNLAIDTAKSNCVAFDTTFELPKVDKGINAAFYMMIVYLVLLFLALVGFMMLVPYHINRQQKLMNALKQRLRGQTGNKALVAQLAKNRLSSLFNHPSVGQKMRYMVPVAIMSSCLLFIIANFFTLGAEVLLSLEILGDTTNDIPLFKFTLEVSINDAWNSGAIPLALIIVVASGYWPYTKIVLLMFSWFVPATILLPHKRGNLIEVLDTLGKWSLIDAYVLIILQVAFRIYLTSATVDQFNVLPEGLLTVDVLVNPGFGIYGFVLATMGSLLVNHVMIWVHEKAVEHDDEIEDQINGHVISRRKPRRIALKNYAYRRGDEVNGVYHYYGFGPGTKVIVGALLGLSFLFICVGLFVPLLTFTFSGIVGIFLQVVDENLASTTNSALSIAGAVADGAKPDVQSQLGIIFLQIVYVGFVAITPIATLFLFGVLWFRKLTLNAQKQLYFATMIVAAWEALAVLIVSVIAALFQIQQLVAFVLVAATGSVCTFVPEQLSLLGVSPSDAACFDVVASLEPTAVILIFGMLLLIITGFIMFRLLGTAIRDRELYEDQRYEQLVHPKEMKGTRGFVVRNLVKPTRKGNPPQYAKADLFKKQQEAFTPKQEPFPITPSVISEDPFPVESTARASRRTASKKRSLRLPIRSSRKTKAVSGSKTNEHITSNNPMFLQRENTDDSIDI